MTKVYVETSSFGYYYDDRAPRERDAIRALLARVQRGLLEGITSETTLEELRAAPEALAARLVPLPGQTGVRVVAPSEEARRLASDYLAAAIIPRRYPADALHIAVAVLERADVIASNNMDHLVNFRRVGLVNKLHTGRGLPPVDIRTPEELL